MKNVFTFCLVLMLPGVAQAHPGHIADVAGHGHWIGLAAAGLAIGVAIWAGLKTRGKDRSEDAESESEEEEQAA